MINSGHTILQILNCHWQIKRVKLFETIERVFFFDNVALWLLWSKKMFFQFRACWKSLKNFGNISDPLIFVSGVYKIVAFNTCDEKCK